MVAELSRPAGYWRRPRNNVNQLPRSANISGPVSEARRAGVGGRRGRRARRAALPAGGSHAVIPKVNRGGKTPGVLIYLAAKGKRKEHENTHLIAGSPEPIGMGPSEAARAARATHSSVGAAWESAGLPDRPGQRAEASRFDDPARPDGLRERIGRPRTAARGDRKPDRRRHRPSSETRRAARVTTATAPAARRAAQRAPGVVGVRNLRAQMVVLRAIRRVMTLRRDVSV